ncbi:MAG TPA: FtsX-like permease family protein, partial [Puia sp.]|nr:FtsX-like permease family protein [Puia sp.]
KEIGIRKVLGASVASIVATLTGEFIKPVIIATLMAFPLAWWGMNQWLQEFAYRITINGGEFILAGFFALIIAMATVSFQAITAAIANPVRSLRTE